MRVFLLLAIAALAAAVQIVDYCGYGDALKDAYSRAVDGFSKLGVSPEVSALVARNVERRDYYGYYIPWNKTAVVTCGLSGGELAFAVAHELAHEVLGRVLQCDYGSCTWAHESGVDALAYLVSGAAPRAGYYKYVYGRGWEKPPGALGNYSYSMPLMWIVERYGVTALRNPYGSYLKFLLSPWDWGLSEYDSCPTDVVVALDAYTAYYCKTPWPTKPSSDAYINYTVKDGYTYIAIAATKSGQYKLTVLQRPTTTTAPTTTTQQSTNASRSSGSTAVIITVSPVVMTQTVVHTYTVTSTVTQTVTNFNVVTKTETVPVTFTTTAYFTERVSVTTTDFVERRVPDYFAASLLAGAAVLLGVLAAHFATRGGRCQEKKDGGEPRPAEAT